MPLLLLLPMFVHSSHLGMRRVAIRVFMGLFETSGLGLVFGFAVPSHYEAAFETTCRGSEDLAGTSEAKDEA